MAHSSYELEKGCRINCVVSVNNIDVIVSFTCRATAKFSAVVQQAVHEEGFGRVWLFKVVEVFQKDRNGQQNCLYAVY